MSDHSQTSHLLKVLQSNQALSDTSRELARLKQEAQTGDAEVSLQEDIKRAMVTQPQEAT